MNSAPALLEQYTKRLEESGVLNSLREAKTIMGRILNIDPELLFECLDIRIDEDTLKKIDLAIQERAGRKPIDRIFGDTIFGNIHVQIPDGVYKPYPESEQLIEHALDLFPDKSLSIRILDLGYGHRMYSSISPQSFT